MVATRKGSAERLTKGGQNTKGGKSSVPQKKVYSLRPQQRKNYSETVKKGKEQGNYPSTRCFFCRAFNPFHTTREGDIVYTGYKCFQCKEISCWITENSLFVYDWSKTTELYFHCGETPDILKGYLDHGLADNLEFNWNP